MTVIIVTRCVMNDTRGIQVHKILWQIFVDSSSSRDFVLSFQDDVNKYSTYIYVSSCTSTSSFDIGILPQTFRT